MSARSETRTGLIFGFAAFGMWGLLPLYWHLLSATPAAEVLAHRMVWSLPVAALILLAVRRWAWIRPLLRDPRKLGMAALSALLISANWYLFIWAVSSGLVLEASLGYFINPLITIAIGVLLLRERLRPFQWVAVGVGASSVAVMTFAYGQVPWVALGLSTSFAAYGLLKKKSLLDGLEGFSADALLQFLPALGFLLLLSARGDSTFTAEGPTHALLLAGAGLATALPLILFGAATMRVPLSTIGMMQYLGPATMFLLGLTVFHEEMPPARLAGFLLVWAALLILTFDALRTARRNRAALRAARAQAANDAAAVPADADVAAGEAAPVGEPAPAGEAAVGNASHRREPAER
ncbi:EamA family transporter RarD [Streptomyces alkaliterrae]|uniref:EamA family transporter RarD n=1 Tax=Streptomyces alkaliterrae TaxID=2213162 RepID=A0A5P0YX19_9ACTN|nr:EamA family transporter RarD [Streptomyces alkaliterrae]MBB1261702.1 EamA family transporter RarD [Streptomyces alkaliterrae]MQS03039.1 EamA family transporter RarD [Streptomyces alkaliterrae]